MKFRYDINALRALAVALVTLYHFKVPGFAAGFIGVDVFFVISGFLMTSIVCKHSPSQPFSLWAFYTARVSRIIPALYALILVLTVLGYFLLIPEYYQKFARNAVASLVFFQTIVMLLNLLGILIYRRKRISYYTHGLCLWSGCFI